MNKKQNTSEVRAAFVRNYLQMQYTFVQFLTEHLVDCVREFDGDLEQMLILAVLGQRALAESLGAVGETDLMRSSMTASRLADVSGLPRETVRRKLAKLAERGWISQDGKGAWGLVREDQGAPVRRDLADVDMRGLERLARLYVQLSALV